ELQLFREEAGTRGLELGREPGPTTAGYTAFVQAAPADGFPAALVVLYGAERAYFDAWAAVRAGADATPPYWRFVAKLRQPAGRPCAGRLRPLSAAPAWPPDEARRRRRRRPSPAPPPALAERGSRRPPPGHRRQDREPPAAPRSEPAATASPRPRPPPGSPGSC